MDVQLGHVTRDGITVIVVTAPLVLFQAATTSRTLGMNQSESVDRSYRSVTVICSLVCELRLTENIVRTALY